MPALPIAEVPEPGVPTAPGGVQVLGELSGLRDPGGIEICALFKVNVEEMIGGGQARGAPALHMGVRASADVGSDFKKVN